MSGLTLSLAFLSYLCITGAAQSDLGSSLPSLNLTTIDVHIPTVGPPAFTNKSSSSITERVSYFVSDGLAIIHGDIIYSTEDELLRRVDAQKRSLSLLDTEFKALWPAGRIDYKWQSEEAKELGRLEAWNEATKRWTDRLPFLEFVEHAANDTLVATIVTLVPTEGKRACFSPVGKADNAYANKIVLDDDCGGAGTYTHELGHSKSTSYLSLWECD